MKKVIVKNLEGIEIGFVQIEDAQPWIDAGVGQNVWGLPERPEMDAEGNPTGVMLPAEYTVEVVDISHEHALEQCIAARKAAYPTPEEFMNAFFDGGEQAIEIMRQVRLTIKAAHPKPVKEA